MESEPKRNRLDQVIASLEKQPSFVTERDYSGLFSAYMQWQGYKVRV
jgi:hypothetical protein